MSGEGLGKPLSEILAPVRRRFPGLVLASTVPGMPPRVVSDHATVLDRLRDARLDAEYGPAGRCDGMGV